MRVSVAGMCKNTKSVTPFNLRYNNWAMPEDNSQRTDSEIRNSILTTTYRKLLQSNVSSGITTERGRIRERVREGLRDFRILADDLEDRDREQIFDAEPHSEEYRELEEDIANVIEFLYAGMGGKPGFDKALKRGVARGEADLGNVDYALDVQVRFDVDEATRMDEHEAREAIQKEEWDSLTPADLFAFVRVAQSNGAIDYDKMRSPKMGPRSRTREKARELKEEREGEDS